MTISKKNLIAYKLFFGLLGFSAIITEIATLVERGNFNPMNFFSYFTIEGNIFVSVVLLLSAVAVAWGKGSKLDAVRRAAAVYILIVGFGFSFMLAGLEDTKFTAVPWDNIVLHYIMPAAMLFDLLLDRPKQTVPLTRALPWLAFPVLYVAYSLIRGSATGWYPYPFMNPNNGYAGVAVSVTLLMVMALALTWVVCGISNKNKSVPKNR